ncbi:MAG: SDR family NAD(P)-dependent oxidoreductase [Dehalococcoidia bacterium]
MSIVNRTALVTGASSGIGRATAAALLDAHCRVIAVSRRKPQLVELASDHEGMVLPVEADVRDRAALSAAYKAAPPSWRKVDFVVNAAGLALGSEPLQTGDPEDWDRVLDTNVKGFLNVIHLVVPGMVERGTGHVVAIGSIGARNIYPGGAVYCASKAAVERIAAGLRLDTMGTGVKVTAIHPARTRTAFHEVRFRGDRSRAEALYEEFKPLEARDVANAVLYVLSEPQHVNVSDLLLTPTEQGPRG